MESERSPTFLRQEVCVAVVESSSLRCPDTRKLGRQSTHQKDDLCLFSKFNTWILISCSSIPSIHTAEISFPLFPILFSISSNLFFLSTPSLLLIPHLKWPRHDKFSSPIFYVIKTFLGDLRYKNEKKFRARYFARFCFR